MKMNLSNVAIDGISIVDSKKNSGGPVCRINLTATMTKSARRHMKIDFVPEGSTAKRHVKPNTGKDADPPPPEIENWPPTGEKAGKLKATFQATELKLTGKQGNTLGEPEEVNIKVSLADSFTWKLADPKDEENRTVRYSFTVRTTEIEAVLLMASYKFSSSSADNTGSLTYTKVAEATDETAEETAE